MQTAFTLILIIIGCLVVAAGVWWLVLRFGAGPLSNTRGRIPRLAVVEEASVDSQRRLVLVRRDNVEHLLLVGGKADIVVELNVARSSPSGRDQLPQRIGAAEPRLAPEGAWATETPRPESLDVPEPPQAPERQIHLPERQIPERQMPERQVPERSTRSSLVDETRRSAPTPTDRHSDALTNFTVGPIVPRSPRDLRPEPMSPRPSRTRSEPLIPRPPRRSEPPKAPVVRAERAERVSTPPPSPHIAPPPHPSASSSVEQNFTEMAQRLEAALRRPSNEAVAPAETPPSPEPPSHSEPPAPTPEGSSKSSFESLEDEMASLLGRTKPSS